MRLTVRREREKERKLTKEKTRFKKELPYLKRSEAQKKKNPFVFVSTILIENF